MCQVSSSELGLIDPCLDPCVLDPCVDFVECALERGIDGAAARPGRRKPVETGLTRARHEPAIGATKSTRLEAPLRCGEPMQLQLWVRIFCLSR